MDCKKDIESQVGDEKQRPVFSEPLPPFHLQMNLHAVGLTGPSANVTIRSNGRAVNARAVDTFSWDAEHER